MKCQQCDKVAVFHITELEEGGVRELHLCEDHARGYLTQAEPVAGEPKSSTGGAISGPLSVSHTADELAALDQKQCSMCGITFFEFRNQGRLGCPHDYAQFEQELEPLIANIHGAVEHTGRRPRRPAGGDLPESTESLTRVIGLRKEIREAVEQEEYERAGTLRDEIQHVLDNWHAGEQAADGSDSVRPTETPSN